jgi:ATP-NAD kinase C-terminal domain
MSPKWIRHATIAGMPALKPKGVLGLVLHPHSDPTAFADTLTTWARSHGKRVIVDARMRRELPDDVAVEPVSATELADQADALISAAGGPLVSPMLDAMIISPVAPISGISRPAVVSAAERIGLALMESSGQPVLQVDGTIARRMQPGEALEVRLRRRAGLLVRLDPTRYRRRSGIKLSLLDLPFLPEEMRDLLSALVLDRFGR